MAQTAGISRGEVSVGTANGLCRLEMDKSGGYKVNATKALKGEAASAGLKHRS
jgi:hypothetical protein